MSRRFGSDNPSEVFTQKAANKGPPLKRRKLPNNFYMISLDWLFGGTASKANKQEFEITCTSANLKPPSKMQLFKSQKRLQKVAVT